MNLFFEKLLLEPCSTHEAIIKVLVARGFLVDKINDKFYLSDNADFNDLGYLSDGLDKYDLGKLQGAEILSLNRYKSVFKIRPNTAQIVLNEDARIEDAIRMFNEKNKIGFEISEEQKRWSEFLFRTYGEKVAVGDLEPYVAYLVKALSACGVSTSFSCDGNHENGGKLIVRSHYPYCMWMRFLWRKYGNGVFGIDGDIEKGLKYRNELEMYECFYKIYMLADYLYQNRQKIRELKILLCNEIEKQRKINKYINIENEFIKLLGEVKDGV